MYLHILFLNVSKKFDLLSFLASSSAKLEGTEKPERTEKKEFPPAVIRVTLASLDEYNILLQNGLNFYDATFFPTEANILYKGAKIEYKRR